jgi:AraC-like DNA-binding protein
MRKGKSMSLFLKLFMAFVLILVIPVLLVSITYFTNTLAYFRKELFHNNTEKLFMAQGYIEASLNEIQNDIKQIALSKSIENLNRVQQNTTDTGKNIPLISDALQLLYSTRISNPKIHSIYLYDYNTRNIYTSDRIVMKEYEFHDTDWIWEYGEKKSSLLWMKTRKCGIPPTSKNTAKNSLTGEEKVITMVYPAVFISSFNGLIAVNIKESEISKVLEESVVKPVGEITVMNQKGHVIISSKKDLAMADISEISYISDILRTEARTGFLPVEAEGKSYLVNYAKSDYNDWIFVNMYSFESILSGIDSLRNIFIFIACAMTLLGIPSCYLISKKLYNPVKGIIENIRSQKGIKIVQSKNEMTVISSALNDILKQGNQFRSYLERNTRKLRESSLLSLLYGNVNHESIQDLPFTEDYFLCIVVSIDHAHRFMHRNTPEERYYTKEFILKVYEDILNESWKCAGVQFEKENLVFILNFTESRAVRAQAELEPILSGIKKKIYEVIDGTVTTAVGNYYKGRSKIESSFTEARNLLKYRMLYGSDKILTAWSVNHEPDMEYYYPASLEKHIFNYLKLGMREELRGTFNAFIDEIRNRNLSYDNIIQAIHQLIGEIVKYMLNEHLNPVDVFSTKTSLYQHLSTLGTLDEIRLWLNNIFVSILDYVEIRDGTQNKYIILIQDYFQNHYQEDVSFEELSARVGISYSHLRKLFREELNTTIIDYLNTLRIEKSKRLLKDTNSSLQEIAASVGYNNIQSFKRFFKKYEGITPAEYRKI